MRIHIGRYQHEEVHISLGELANGLEVQVPQAVRIGETEAQDASALARLRDCREDFLHGLVRIGIDVDWSDVWCLTRHALLQSLDLLSLLLAEDILVEPGV